MQYDTEKIREELEELKTDTEGMLSHVEAALELVDKIELAQEIAEEEDEDRDDNPEANDAACDVSDEVEKAKGSGDDTISTIETLMELLGG